MSEGRSLLPRLLAGMVLLGSGAAAVLLLSTGRPESSPPEGRGAAPRFTSSRQCESCHRELYAEWKRSHHAIAYTNPEVRKLSNDFRTKECQDCHLPRPVFETGIAEPPLPRQARPDEGVDCLTCHLAPNGRILGAKSNPKAGCAPLAEPGISSVSLCETCHNQHQTTDQFRASKFAKEPGGCNACHMPVEERKGRGGRRHVFEGAHDPATLKKAARFEARIEGDELLLEVRNDGAGHNFPTEERHRAVDVLYRVLEPGVESGPWTPPFRRVYRFRQPYLGDPGPNTQLPAGRTWKGKVSLDGVPLGSRIQCLLVYKLQPFVEDREATILHRRELRR